MRRRDGSAVQLAMLVGEMAIFFASGALVYVLISRTSGAELLGHYSIVLSWLTLLQAFAGFGMAEWVMREVGRAPEDGGPVGQALALGLVTSLAAGAAMVGLSSLWGYPPEVQRALALAALALPATTISQVCRGAFVARGRSQHVFAIRVLEFLAIVPANAFLLLRGTGIETLISVIVAGRVVGAAASLVLLRAQGLRIGLARGLPGPGELATVAPFAASQALGLLATNLNLIMLSAWAPIEVVGFYGAAAKLVDALLVFPTVVGTFSLPRLAAAAAAPPADTGTPGGVRETTSFEPPAPRGLDDPGFRRALAGLFAVMVLGAGGLAVFAEWVLRLLYGPDFGTAAPTLRLLMLYCALVTADAMTSVVLKATDHQRTDVMLFSLNPALNAALNLALIPALGAVGAALGAVAGVLASLGLRYRFIARTLGPPRWAGLARGPLVAAGAGALGVAALRGRIPEPVLFATWSAASAWLLARAIGLGLGDRGRLGRAPAAGGSGS